MVAGVLVPTFLWGQRAPTDSVTTAIRAHLSKGDELRKVAFVQESLQHYFDALRLAEDHGLRALIATTCVKIGGLYEHYYRYIESVPYLKRSYSLLRGSDSLTVMASVANSIAWNYIKTGGIDSALVYSEESVARYEKLQPRETFNYCIALESLGEIYALKGRFVDADRVLALCMRLAQENNNPIAVGFTHYGIAFSQLKQKRYEQARQHIMKCLPVAEKFAAQQLLADVYQLCYQVHRALSLNGPAYDYLQRYTALKDKIHSEDIEKKAAIINANYEIQKKEDDLKILNQVNAIQQLEIERQALIRNLALGGLVVFVLLALLIYNRIQAKRKFEQQELQRKKDELEQGRKMQLSLLPQKPMDNGNVEVRGKMITATEVGGDYFDYFKLDDHRVFIAFGDATGHGLTAGLIVTIAKVALVNNLSGLKESNNLVAVIKAINDSILSSVSVKGIGLALQLFLIDSQQRKLHYTSCGMPYPMLFDFATRELQPLEMRQPPLGFLRQLKVEQKEIEFQKAHLLILATDGIFERFNRAKEEYGWQRFKTAAEAQLQKSTDFEQLLEAFFQDADLFSQSTPHHDDMTALCARLR